MCIRDRLHLVHPRMMVAMAVAVFVSMVIIVVMLMAVVVGVVMVVVVVVVMVVVVAVVMAVVMVMTHIHTLFLFPCLLYTSQPAASSSGFLPSANWPTGSGGSIETCGRTG